MKDQGFEEIFELLEAMLIVAAIGILVAVAAPKFFCLMRASDIGKYKEQDWELYLKACLAHPERCSKEDLKTAVITVCGGDASYCSGRYSHDLPIAKITTILDEGKDRQMAVEVHKDTVYVEKRDTVYSVLSQDGTSVISSKIETESGSSREESSASRDECIKKCKLDNTTDGLVLFCIRDNCKVIQ